MKRQFTTVRTLAASLVLAAVLGTSAMAQKTVTSSELNVQYAGKLNDQPVFEVAYNKSNNEAYTLTIKDATGYVFYEEVFKNNYSKKFLLDIPELNNTEIIVTLTDKKGNEKQVYRINSKFSQVQDYSVTKL